MNKPFCFGKIDNTFHTQQKLQKHTLHKEGNFFREKTERRIRGELSVEGQSTVFQPTLVFGYFYAFYEIVSRHIRQYSNGKKNVSVLEIGCGTGWGIFFLASKFPKVTFLATNIDKFSIKYAESIYAGKNLKFEVANGLAQGKYKRKFDIVFFNEVIEHFDPAEQVTLIKQSLNSLKQGGLVLFSTPSREFLFGLPTLGSVGHKMEYSSVRQLSKFLHEFRNKNEISEFEVNRVIGKNYARFLRSLTIPFQPVLIILRILRRLGIKPDKLVNIFNSKGERKRSKFVQKYLDLYYENGTTKDIERQTIAYFSLVKSG